MFRVRHMTFKWNVCILCIDSCSTPQEFMHAIHVINHHEFIFCQTGYLSRTVCLESRCALRLWYIDLVVSIKVAVAVCYCFTVFSC
jgi:hypothetical protein